MGIKEKLIDIQSELKAPKNQYNHFGEYNYRSCEDILEALKPLLKKNNCCLCIKDRIEQVGDRFYLVATVTIMDAEKDESITCEAYARETDSRPKMDAAQITGTASSYARKYALNGLFLIDDAKDADTDEFAQRTGAEPKKASEKQIDLIKKLVDDEKIPNLLSYYKVKALEDLTTAQASDIINKKKGENK